MEVGLFYGSTNGATASAARRITTAMMRTPGVAVELLDVAEFYLEEMLEYRRMILGIPTWNHGQLQADWENVFDEFDGLDLTDRQIGLFGLGDQLGYPDTFGDALFFLADKVRSRGARLVGSWPVEGYSFRQSWAVESGVFLGLMLDEDNQPEQTEQRIAQWTEKVLSEFEYGNVK